MLAKSKVPAIVAYLGAAVVLLCTEVVNEEEFMQCFGSEPVVVHVAFFIVIAGLIHTGVFYWVSRHVLGTPGNYGVAMIKLMVPAAVMSALLSSINVVALLVDMVRIWARRLAISPARLLMPLSYAASLGGLCTLLGSSANLVLASQYAEKTGQHLSLFAPLVPGLVLTIAGVALVMLMRKFIPERATAEESFESTSDYTVELLVPTDNEAVGSTADEAGLRNVKGGSLIEIVRFDKEIITPVPKDEFILGGDRLIYSGNVNEILELKNSKGLVAATHHVYSMSEIDNNRKLRTAYVSFGSQLIGTRMSANDFEETNNVVLVAVARHGQRVDQQPREVVLAAGDSLLLECPQGSMAEFDRSNKKNLTFFDSHFVPQLGKKTVLSAATVLMIMVLSLFNVMPLMAVTMLAAVLMVVFGCCRKEKIAEYIEWDLILNLGCILVISTALGNVHIADFISTYVISWCGNDPFIVFAVLCVLASIVSEFVLDVGAAAIFFPLAYYQASVLGVDPEAFVIGLMMAVGISFASPLSKTTHLLVYGVGGFKFTDFFRTGLVLHIVLLVISILMVAYMYGII